VEIQEQHHHVVDIGRRLHGRSVRFFFQVCLSGMTIAKKMECPSIGSSWRWSRERCNLRVWKNWDFRSGVLEVSVAYESDESGGDFGEALITLLATFTRIGWSSRSSASSMKNSRRSSTRSHSCPHPI